MSPRFLGLFSGLFIIAALVLGMLAWINSRQATVVIEWSTASELDTAGFNLYRGESPSGPFTKVNATLIPTLGDPLIGGSYSFDDRGLTPGQTYSYRLEEVEYSGNTTTFGPIEVTVKRGGLNELILALVAAGGGIGGVRLLLRARRSRRNSSSELSLHRRLGRAADMQ